MSRFSHKNKIIFNPEYKSLVVECIAEGYNPEFADMRTLARDWIQDFIHPFASKPFTVSPKDQEDLICAWLEVETKEKVKFWLKIYPQIIEDEKVTYHVVQHYDPELL